MSCCEAPPGTHLATLTVVDVERIALHVGRHASAFAEDEWLTEEEALRYEARRPVYAGYFRHGPRRLTLRRAGGACVFLNRANGCVLPEAVRPTACRLYPFESTTEGWSLQVDRHGGAAEARAAGGAACLAVEEAPDLEALMRAFGTSEQQLELLVEYLRREVSEHARRTAPGSASPRARRR